MKKYRPSIFRMITYYTHVNIHAKRKFPCFIHFSQMHGQNRSFPTLHVKCSNCRKMKKAKLMSFSMNNYQIYLSIHAENQFHSFITFFWLYGQIICFRQKYVKCSNCNEIKKARPLIFSMSTYHIHVSIHTKRQFPGFLHISAIDTFHFFSLKCVI